jgi:hypothetical protein
MNTLINYATSRHSQKRHGWGRTWCRWLWLDAIAFAVARYATLMSPWFRRWCREVDRLFIEQYEWPRSMVADTGFDCWIDSYWYGDSPQEAVDNEVDCWDE